MVVPGVSSVGDIIALCTLVTSTFTALHSTHGSQAEWLHVHKGIQTLLAAAVTIRDDCKQQLEQISGVAVGYGRELESLKDILQQIKQEAQQCQILMEEFRKAFKSVIKIFEAPAGTLRLQRSLHKLRYPLQHSDSVHNFQREFKDRLFALHIRFTVFNSGYLNLRSLLNQGSTSNALDYLGRRITAVQDGIQMLGGAPCRLNLMRSLGGSWSTEPFVLILDALGRRYPLPLFMVETPEKLKGSLLLNHEGRQKNDIERNAYVVSDECSGILIALVDWSERVVPGGEIGISFLQAHPAWCINGRCPRCRSRWVDEHVNIHNCQKCRLVWRVEDQNPLARFKKALLPGPPVASVPAQASAPSSRHAETSTEESKHKSLARQGTLLQGQFDDSYSRIQYERNTCSGGTIIPIWSKEEPEFRRFLEQLPPLHRSAADGTLTYGQLEEYTPEELNEPWNCPDSVYRHDRTGWDFIGAPPIHFAAYFGNVQSLFLLLDKGAGIEEKDAAGTTALHAAAWTGNAEIFKILMNREADLEAHDLDGWSVEIYALLQNQEYILKLLESYHRDKEVVPDHCTVRAFAKLNKTDMLEAKLNSPTLQNNAREKVRLMTAALCGAAEGGHVDLVRKLLTEAAVADNADESGCTPLHWVGWGGHTEIQVTQLNQSGEREVADRSWNGLRSEQHEEIVKILVVHGASVNKWNLQHCTPLHWVAGAGCIAMAKCFLDYGADRSIVDSEGRTPLRRAEESTDDKMCELLRSYLR